MTLKLGMQHRVLRYYQVCSNDAPWLTLTYFTARSNLVLYAFVQEKVKTMAFSKTIVVHDIKVGRCSQLKWVHEALWVPKVKVIHWPWSNSIRFNIFKLLFHNNRWFQHIFSTQVSDTGPVVLWFIWHVRWSEKLCFHSKFCWNLRNLLKFMSSNKETVEY